MVTITKIGPTFFVSGSSIEGAAYARHFAQQSMQDFDFMLVEGIIKSPDCLIKLNETDAFVQIKYDKNSIEKYTKNSFSIKQNINGILCINGYKMKENLCGTESITFIPTLELIQTGQTTINSASTEIKFKSISSTITLNEQFENALNSIRRIHIQDNINSLQEKFQLACKKFQKIFSQYALPMTSSISNAHNINLQTCLDIISLTCPAYKIKMPVINKIRLNSLLNFYEKYKYLGNPLILENHIEYGKLCIDNEADFVPALQLEFWPDDIKFFLNRIQINRPDLYKLIIETSSMHLIPKWSTKTSEIDQDLEFRYSFSAIERLLAINRTQIEQILNGVARSIYYKYLKKQSSIEDNTKPIIPSYVIKTTVLWMCELMNLNDQLTDTDNNQIIARIMAQKWLEFIKKILYDGICEHYFIKNMNLLESCSRESLDKAINILQNDVNLDENVSIEIFTIQDELINKQRQTIENWIGNLKIKDILNALNDYRLLKDKWLCPSPDNQDYGDIIGCIHTLNTLRTLDGDKQQNWTIFKHLFLDIDDTNWLPPIWDEQVENSSISDFADCLSALGTTLSSILSIMEKPEIDEEKNIDFNQYEISNVQNILNDLTTPSNMVRNGLISSWLPMFTSSYFNTLPTGISSDVRSSFQHRSITTDHPIGPLNNLLQNISLPSQIDSTTRQIYHQYSQHVSNNFLNLLYDAPNDNMTLNDLIKYHEPSPPQIISQNETTSSISKEIISYATNISLINKEQNTLIIYDPNLTRENIEEDIYHSINDYVLFYSDKSQLLKYIQSINEEKIFIIIFDCLFDENFLSKLQNFNQINSIFIYTLKEDNFELLINKYSKIIGIYTEKSLLLEQVRLKIDQQSILTFGFYNPQEIFEIYTKLSEDKALFFYNLLLKNLLTNNYSINKTSMIQKCKEYYSKNSIEIENIKQFEETYNSTNAYEWYFKNCFISKQLNKAFYTYDIEQLKLFSFFIYDLCLNIKSTYSIIDKVYYTTLITTKQFELLSNNIGKLITFNGFLVMNNCSCIETILRRNNEEIIVKFEIINVNSIDSNKVIFNLGTIFQLDSFYFDNDLNIWIAHLSLNNHDNEITQNYILTKQQIIERITIPILIGELLLTISSLSKTSTYFDNLQNEDDALIYYYYGYIHYLKGEYNLSLEKSQISYELMVSDERIKDSAFVLHDIGYIYDMTKDFNEALNYHKQALEIRQIYYPENNVYIGISLYNIGRTLVNIGDDDQALIYHQKALYIWKQTLKYNHPCIIQSLHSHGVVYFNKKDYLQALPYYMEALELYEKTIPRDDHGILMVKNALETINDIISR